MSAACAQPAEFVRYEKLDCGARLCVVEDHSRPLVSVQLWFAAGSANDPRSLSGITMLTHVLIDAQTGASASAASSGFRVRPQALRDACTLAFTLPPDDLADALTAVAARLQPLRVTQAHVTDCANRLADRYAMSVGASGPREAVTAALLRGHPYETPPDRVAAKLREISAETVMTHWQRWFAPSAATLVVVGDIDTDAVVAATRDALKIVEWRDAARLRGVDPPAREHVKLSSQGGDLNDDGSQFVFGWLTGPHSSRESLAASLLMTWLVNRLDGPLTIALREHRLTASFDLELDREFGRLLLTVEPEGSTALQVRRPADSQPTSRWSLDAVRAAVEAGLESVADGGCPPEALVRAQADLSAEYRSRLSDFDVRADEIARVELIGGDALMFAFLDGRIRAMDVGDVQRAAIELLSARRAAASSVVATSRPAVAATRPARLEPAAVEAAIRGWIQADCAAAARTAKPPPKPPSATNWVRTTASSGHLLTSCELPGVEWLTVGVESDRLSWPGRLPGGTIVDYLSFNGIEMTASPAFGRLNQDGRVLYSGRAGQLESLIELVCGHVADRGATASESSRFVAAGAVAAGNVQAALEAEWNRIAPAAGHPTAAAGGRESRSDARAGIAPEAARSHGEYVSAGITPTSYLEVTFEPRGEIEPPVAFAAPYLLGRCLGASPSVREAPQAANGLRSWSIHRPGSFSIYYVTPDDDSLLAALDTCITLLKRVESGELAAGAGAGDALLHVAARDAWCDLGRREMLIDALLRGRTDPWRALAATQSIDAGAELGRQMRDLDVSIRIGGPSAPARLEDARRIARRFRDTP